QSFHDRLMPPAACAAEATIVRARTAKSVREPISSFRMGDSSVAVRGAAYPLADLRMPSLRGVATRPGARAGSAQNPQQRERNNTKYEPERRLEEIFGISAANSEGTDEQLLMPPKYDDRPREKAVVGNSVREIYR